MEGAQFEEARVPLGRDDVVVFFSDGITDRSAQDGQLYGVERLKAAAVRSRGDAARLALYSLLGDVQGFSAGTPADDDMTLIGKPAKGPKVDGRGLGQLCGRAGLSP
jgi:serine phosphatase RsbU (regulator of sigma subunit)